MESKGAKEFQNLKNMGGVRLRKTDVKSWSFESWKRGKRTAPMTFGSNIAS